MERIDSNSEVPAMRFLGVYFDPSLNFKYHVEKLLSKLSRALYTLRSVKNVLTPKSLKSLYYSLFHCHLATFPIKWDTLPIEISSIRNKIEFDDKLKNYFLDKLANHIECVNLFCPTCFRDT
jgi:hypothetical protein